MSAVSTGSRRPLGGSLRPTGKVLPEHARAHNRSLVLQRIFADGEASRADLARATGLTRVTVSDLVAELVAEGLVEERGLRAGGRVGKPATLIGLREDAFRIVALDLADDTRFTGAVLTLLGDVIERRAVALDHAAGAEALDLLTALCRDLLAAADRPVLGLGIGSPGVIDPSGRIVEAPNLSWYDLPLAAELSERLGVPVHVANDANVAALGEYAFGEASGSGFMVVTVGHGVGAGIVLDGALVRGPRNAAGEIGHVTVVDGPDAPACACGRRGCLETLLAVPALRAKLAGAAQGTSDAELASVGRLLGVALAPVVSALNLAEVVFSGPTELLDGPLREAVQTTIRERTMPVIGGELSIRMASLHEDVALRGAAVLVLSGQLGVT